MESIKEYLPGTIENPIVDSEMNREEAFQNLTPQCPEEIKENQELLSALYYSFDGKIHKGQIIVDKNLAADVIKILDLSREIKFPVEKVIPISKYNWNDEESMAANNSSGFNYRRISGSEKFSNHAFGFAIDINPFLNPYINKEGKIFPSGAKYEPGKDGVLDAEHLIVKKFKELGWTWGGDWKDIKDYQHFEKVAKSL